MIHFRWGCDIKGHLSFLTAENSIERNLFQIYEWLRASQPDILRMHHAYIEGQYIEFKTLGNDQGRKLKKAWSHDVHLSSQEETCTQTQDTIE